MPKSPLESVHKALGAVLVERGGMPTAVRYGDVGQEHEMVRRAVGVFDFCSAGKIAVSGRERVRVLQGLLAADVGGLESGRGTHSLALSPDGRVAAEMRVVTQGDAVLLLTPSLARAKVRTLFERHLAEIDASVVDETETMALLSAQGPVADLVMSVVFAQTPPELPPYGSTVLRTDELGPVVVVRAPRGGETGWDMLLPATAAPRLFERLVENARRVGGGPAGLDALDAMRVEAGIPAFGVDFDETTLPGELGDALRGISMEKGCFLGREALARQIAAGDAKRRLVGLFCEGGWPLVHGDRLLKDGEPVGAVTSSAQSPVLGRPVALAMVAVEASAPATELMTADGDRAVVASLPFWTRG